MIKLLHGDCLKLMNDIEAGSIDMIFCDLPYGTTQNKWDSIIPFEPLWRNYERIIKPNGAIVLTATQPFTSALVMSNPKLFKYEWIYRKTIKTGVLNAKRQPLREHESVLVFYKSQPTYNPQGLVEGKTSGGKFSQSPSYGEMSGINNQTHTGYPGTVQTFSNPNNNNLHPTQKPLALLEYLIKTYTEEGDTVLDNCMGSGTTGVACQKLNRHFIGIEMDDKYFEVAQKRLSPNGGDSRRGERGQKIIKTSYAAE